MLLVKQVLQYKKRCGDLEQQALDKTSEVEKLRLLVCSPDVCFLSSEKKHASSATDTGDFFYE